MVSNQSISRIECSEGGEAVPIGGEKESTLMDGGNNDLLISDIQNNHGGVHPGQHQTSQNEACSDNFLGNTGAFTKEMMMDGSDAGGQSLG
jgi:hypothetical protein